jgi:hypothetical protein
MRHDQNVREQDRRIEAETLHGCSVTSAASSELKTRSRKPPAFSGLRDIPANIVPPAASAKPADGRSATIQDIERGLFTAGLSKWDCCSKAYRFFL